MKIKEVCEKTGLTDRAIRYYIENGLVFPDKKENYAGRRNFSFSDNDIALLTEIKILRNSGFGIAQIKELKNNKSVHTIVCERLNELEKERNLSDAIYIALTKVSTNKNLTTEELITALNNPSPFPKTQPKDESAPLRYLFHRAKTIITALSVCLLAFFLFATILFFTFDGPQWIKTRTQSGMAVLTVREDGELLTTENYSLNDSLSTKNGENGYLFAIDYGEIRSYLSLDDGFQIEFGLINTNNWHHLDISIDIVHEDDNMIVTQTVTYLTDENLVESLTTSATIDKNAEFVSVFRDGL